MRRTFIGIAVVAGLIAIGALAVRVTAGSELADRMLTVFLSFSDRLPIQMSFEQFLIVGLLICVCVTALVIIVAFVFLLLMRTAVAAPLTIPSMMWPSNQAIAPASASVPRITVAW